VCQDTVIELGTGETVIAGTGIGPSGVFPVTIKVKGKSSKVFILVDCTQAPVTIITDLPSADVTVFALGTHPITFKGTMNNLILGGQGDVNTGTIKANGSVLISTAHGLTFNGAIKAKGDITVGGGLSLSAPTCS
jgi:hypothetical protein